MMEPRDIFDFKNGSTEAFEKLYKEYWNRVYKFTGLFVDDDFERDDIVQEVFFRIWKKRSLIDTTKEFDGFLFITTRNLIFNRLRKTGHPEAIESVAESAGVSYDDQTESRLDAEYMKGYIDKLVDLLPDRQREAFMMSRTGHLSIRQIAQKMGISESGVKRNINLAIKFIKTNLPLLVLFLNI